MGGRTLEDEKKNDLMKRNIALEIGYKLIVVDARESSLKYIRKSIEKNDEQNVMNQRGGVQHLDKKRNAIRPSGWSKYKVKPIK